MDPLLYCIIYVHKNNNLRLTPHLRIVHDVYMMEYDIITSVVLMPSEWNTKNDCDGAWRLDVDIECADNIDDKSDKDSVKSDSEEGSYDFCTDSEDERLN